MESLHAILIPRQAPSTNQSNDQNIGSARDNESPSLSGLISTLVPTLIIAIAYFSIFILLRTRFPRQYAPRTYLGALRPQERTPAPPNTLFGWIPFMRKVRVLAGLPNAGSDTNLPRFLTNMCFNTTHLMATSYFDISNYRSSFASLAVASLGPFCFPSMPLAVVVRNNSTS